MIVPITAEAEWLAALSNAKTWTPPSVPTVVLAPHPDDETLGAGGLIRRLTAAGVPVTVIAVTDGENAYEGEAGLGPLRDAEQAAALAVLGVERSHIHRLHFVDSGVSAEEDRLAAALAPLLAPAQHIVAPWPHDFHPDHEVVGRAAQRVAAQHGIPLTSYFFWTWHRGTPALLEGESVVQLRLTGAERRAKREALLCHVSQLQHASCAPILPEDLLEPAWRPFETFLPHTGIQ